MSRPLTPLTWPRRLWLLLAIASTLVVGPASALGFVAGAAPTGLRSRPTLVYKMSRSTLSVSLTRRGDRIVRASVSAPGRCENGEREPMGFGLSGGSGIRIHPDGHFVERYSSGFYFGGRFEGGKVSGVFFESRRRQFEGEASEPYCGNIVPRGRAQRYVARLVERSGHRNI